MRESGCQPPNQKNLPQGFLDFDGLLAVVPLGERTIRTLIKSAIIPHIRVKNGRRILFFYPAVEASLRRFSKGGIE